jgi:large subunit ribosomal protein L17
MRHRVKGRKLGRKKSHKEQMLRNMVVSLFRHESIRTTEAKAKEARRLAEKLLTWGKRGDLHSRRLALRYLASAEAVTKVFDDIAPRFAGRDGGYTRIVKLEVRRGDAAPVVVLELTEKSKELEEEKAARKAKREARKEAKRKAEEEAMAMEAGSEEEEEEEGEKE